MNQRTAKLLKRWASASGQNVKKVKRWWLSLDTRQRAKERRKILANLQ